MKIVRDDENEESLMAKYDPAKRYVWTPEDKFTFTGSEFGMILNTFRAMIELQHLINDANQAIERVLAEAVEAGIVKEAPLEPQ